MEFEGFRLNFSKLKLDTFSKSHPIFMAIGPTIMKPSAEQCRSLCKLISKSMQVDLSQTNDRIAVKLD